MRGLLRCFHMENSIIFHCPKNNTSEWRAVKSLCSNWTLSLLPMSESDLHNETMEGALQTRLLEESISGSAILLLTPLRDEGKVRHLFYSSCSTKLHLWSLSSTRTGYNNVSPAVYQQPTVPRNRYQSSQWKFL